MTSILASDWPEGVSRAAAWGRLPPVPHPFISKVTLISSSFPRHILKYHLLSGRAAGPGPALPRGGAAIFGTAPGARLNTIKVTATPQKLCRLSENKAKHHRLLLSDKLWSYISSAYFSWIEIAKP